jgi:integrase
MYQPDKLRAGIRKFLEAAYPEGSFHFVLQEFLGEQDEAGLSVHSIDHLYVSLFPLAEALEGRPPGQVTARWLNEYGDRLWLKYVVDTMGPVLGDIRQFFRWCVEKGYCRVSPAARLKLSRRAGRRRQRTTKKVKAVEEDRVLKTIDYLLGLVKHLIYRDVFGNLVATSEGWGDEERRALRDLFILVFLYETGARAKEVAQLASKEMNEVCRKRRRAYTVTSLGKTDDRDCSFTNATADLWRVWQQVRPAGYEEYAVVGWRKDGKVANLLSNGVSLILVRRSTEAGVKVFRPHSVRHAKIKRGAQKVGIVITSQLVDHSSPRMTEKYLEANIDEAQLVEATVKTGLERDLWE